MDVVGAVLCALGLAGITYGLIEQPRLGWEDPAVWLPLVAGAALFTAFLVWEARSRHPMLPLSLFRRRNFTFGKHRDLLDVRRLRASVLLLGALLATGRRL